MSLNLQIQIQFRIKIDNYTQFYVLKCRLYAAKFNRHFQIISKNYLEFASVLILIWTYVSVNMTILIMYQWHDIVGIGSNGQTFVMNAEQVANTGSEWVGGSLMDCNCWADIYFNKVSVSNVILHNQNQIYSLTI